MKSIVPVGPSTICCRWNRCSLQRSRSISGVTMERFFFRARTLRRCGASIENMPPPYNWLFDYYTRVRPNRRVLEFCGVLQPDTPYAQRSADLTAIINAYARPEYLPLIWEALQYQSCRPAETWVLQNNPGGRSIVPTAALAQIRSAGDRVIESDLNHGCWFRFVLAALSCRTRFVAILDDDTLPGRLAFETALQDLTQTPGVYGGRGITFAWRTDGPTFEQHEVSGRPAGTPERTQVDFVGHMWVME